MLYVILLYCSPVICLFVFSWQPLVLVSCSLVLVLLRFVLSCYIVILFVFPCWLSFVILFACDIGILFSCYSGLVIYCYIVLLLCCYVVMLFSGDRLCFVL